MCYSIKIVHFGCLDGESHSEWSVVRCKGGLEYIMLLPVKEECGGIKQVEDWRASPCRFCKEYLEGRMAAAVTGGRARAVSLPANALMGPEEDVVFADT